jgi:hypothetical protein
MIKRVNASLLLQWVLVLLFAVTWLVGGNLIVARHYRRRGIRRRRHLPYTSFPWRTLEAREWAMFAGVFVLTIAFLLLALFVGRP